MISVHMICLLFALISFFLSAIGIPSSPRVNLESLGLFFLTLAFLFIK